MLAEHRRSRKRGGETQRPRRSLSEAAVKKRGVAFPRPRLNGSTFETLCKLALRGLSRTGQLLSRCPGAENANDSDMLTANPGDDSLGSRRPRGVGTPFGTRPPGSAFSHYRRAVPTNRTAPVSRPLIEDAGIYHQMGIRPGGPYPDVDGATEAEHLMEEREIHSEGAPMPDLDHPSGLIRIGSPVQYRSPLPRTPSPPSRVSTCRHQPSTRCW